MTPSRSSVGSASSMRNFFAGREVTTAFGILDTKHMNSVVMDVLLNTVRIFRRRDKLLSHLAELKRDGVSAAFITQNLYHAYESCDRFAILSHGKVISTVAKADTTLHELNEIIVKH
jgi:ABC-type sugar transport system ATPase subunit